MSDLTVPFVRFTDGLQYRVVPLDERKDVCMVAGVGDALPVPVPVQQGLVVLQRATLGPEAPGLIRR